MLAANSENSEASLKDQIIHKKNSTMKLRTERKDTQKNKP